MLYNMGPGFGATTLGIMTLVLMTFVTTAFSLRVLFATLSIKDMHYNNTVYCEPSGYCYAESNVFFTDKPMSF